MFSNYFSYYNESSSKIIQIFWFQWSTTFTVYVVGSDWSVLNCFCNCLQYGHATPDTGEVAGAAEGVGDPLHRPDGQQNQPHRFAKVIK